MARARPRQDIQAAVARAGVGIGAGRDMRRLPDHLREGEVVHMLTTGQYGNGFGLLAMTDRRLLFLMDGSTQKISEDFPYGKISSIQWASGLLTGTITIFASGAKSEIKSSPKEAGKALVDAVRNIISRPAQPTPVVTLAEPSAADEIERLAGLHRSGLLTDDEFAAAKAKALGI
jgi:hypothetical protein